MTQTLALRAGKALDRNAMKAISGGLAPGSSQYTCFYYDSSNHLHPIEITADNVNQAQALADMVAYDDRTTDLYPTGIDCPGSLE